jgi:hypothetical protein
MFSQLGVPPDFFKDLRGAANQKSLKNTVLMSTTYGASQHVSREPVLGGGCQLLGRQSLYCSTVEAV